MKPVWAIGLMTGTVLDGMIDVAMIRTDGEAIEEFGPWTLAPYPDDLRHLLADTVHAALDWRIEGPEAGDLPPRRMEALTLAQSAAVSDLYRRGLDDPDGTWRWGASRPDRCFHRASGRAGFGATRANWATAR